MISETASDAKATIGLRVTNSMWMRPPMDVDDDEGDYRAGRGSCQCRVGLVWVSCPACSAHPHHAVLDRPVPGAAGRDDGQAVAAGGQDPASEPAAAQERDDRPRARGVG